VCVADSVLTVRLKPGAHCPLERVVRTRLQSLGSDWGVGLCQLISADSIYDDFLTPAALWHALHSRTPHGPEVAWSVSRRDTFCATQVNFICAKWSFDPRSVRVRRNNCGSTVDRDRCPHNTGGVPLLLYCCRCHPLRIRKPNRTETAVFSSKPNRNRPTLASMKP